MCCQHPERATLWVPTLDELTRASHVISPSTDPFSPKNMRLTPAAVRGLLVAAGLITHLPAKFEAPRRHLCSIRDRAASQVPSRLVGQLSASANPAPLSTSGRAAEATAGRRVERRSRRRPAMPTRGTSQSTRIALPQEPPARPSDRTLPALSDGRKRLGHSARRHSAPIGRVALPLPAAAMRAYASADRIQGHLLRGRRRGLDACATGRGRSGHGRIVPSAGRIQMGLVPHRCNWPSVGGQRPAIPPCATAAHRCVGQSGRPFPA